MMAPSACQPWPTARQAGQGRTRQITLESLGFCPPRRDKRRYVAQLDGVLPVIGAVADVADQDILVPAAERYPVLLRLGYVEATHAIAPALLPGIV